jgi:O-antigen ligase
MTQSKPFSDYEPVRPSGTRKSSKMSLEDEIGFNLTKSPPEPAPMERGRFTAVSKVQPISGESGTKSEPNAARSSAESLSKPSGENWVLRTGHSLSFAGIFLFTALVYFRPYEYFPSLFWLSSSAFWVAITTLLVFLPTQLGLEGRITSRPREVNLVLLLLVAAALSIPFALEPAKAWNGFIDFLKVVVIFVVMINVVRSEKRLKMLWILVLLATCALSIDAINDYRLGRLALMGVRIQGRIGGLFDNPNDLALHLVTMVPISVALMFSSRNPLSKVMYFILALLIIGGVIATFSRGGFLALVISLGVLIWKLARRSRLLLGIVGATLIVLFIVVAPAGYGARVSTTKDDSAIARLDDLKRSLVLAIRHPVFGVGMDNYILFSNVNKATHNAYTQVASEMGIAATVFYVLFMIAPLKRLRNIERESVDTKSRRRFYYLAIGLQASLVAYMVASFFASVAYLWYVYYLVAYSVCLRRIYQAAIARDDPSDGISAPTLGAGSSSKILVE